LFKGVSGSGKKQLVKDFISMIYNNNTELIKNVVMYVNCAQGRGIKFIREELKFFAKSNIHFTENNMFKTIVLLNGDKLTSDAQSALRRCIELFSHNTRFFIIVEDKYKLLKPILSRFCEIYVPLPKYKSNIINLHEFAINNVFKHGNAIQQRRMEWLKKELTAISHIPTPTLNDIQILISKLYNKSYSALDIIKLLKDGFFTFHPLKQYELLIAFKKVKNEIRNEQLLFLFILNFIYLDTTTSLENISFM
jgi:DNA polymerase III delta prime subunit